MVPLTMHGCIRSPLSSLDPTRIIKRAQGDPATAMGTAHTHHPHLHPMTSRHHTEPHIATMRRRHVHWPASNPFEEGPPHEDAETVDHGDIHHASPALPVTF